MGAVLASAKGIGEYVYEICSNPAVLRTVCGVAIACVLLTWALRLIYTHCAAGDENRTRMWTVYCYAEFYWAYLRLPLFCAAAFFAAVLSICPANLPAFDKILLALSLGLCAGQLSSCLRWSRWGLTAFLSAVSVALTALLCLTFRDAPKLILGALDDEKLMERFHSSVNAGIKIAVLTDSGASGIMGAEKEATRRVVVWSGAETLKT